MKFITSLRLARQALDKKRSALIEDVDLNTYLSQPLPLVSPTPFPHLVVDDVFTPEIYAQIIAHFTEVMKRGLSEEKDYTRFHPFLDLTGKYSYDGYVYAPRLGENPVLDLFFSVAWNALFSSSFGQPTGWCTSLAYHFHPPGNRTGFVHNDLASKRFSEVDRLKTGIIYRDRPEPGDIPTFKEKRIIALIYYLGNAPWRPGDGGETGLYIRKDDPSPVALIEPKNNRLLAFQISPNSYHAFQQNVTPRSSIVQWFHVDEAWVNSRYALHANINSPTT